MIKLRPFIFRFTKWLVRKYFNDGLTPVWGTNSEDGKVIAWEWRFYDEEYQERNKKHKL